VYTDFVFGVSSDIITAGAIVSLTIETTELDFRGRAVAEYTTFHIIAILTNSFLT
tara:strand:- start:310 stop:474 length:165 start_codon:yes stop_codon:yes gene_type:complete